MKTAKKDQKRRLEIRLVTDKIIIWLKKFESDETIGSVIQALVQQRESEITSEVMDYPSTAKGEKEKRGNNKKITF